MGYEPTMIKLGLEIDGVWTEDWRDLSGRKSTVSAGSTESPKELGQEDQ